MHLSVWFESHRPRMTTERGNLVFLTGASQNIEFRTGSLGKIKLNNEDLDDCLHQVINIWEGTWKRFCAAILVNARVQSQSRGQAWIILEVKYWAWGVSLEEKQIPGGNFSLGSVRSGRRNARWSVLRCSTLDPSLQQMQRRRCDLFSQGRWGIWGDERKVQMMPVCFHHTQGTFGQLFFLLSNLAAHYLLQPAGLSLACQKLTSLELSMSCHRAPSFMPRISSGCPLRQAFL